MALDLYCNIETRFIYNKTPDRSTLYGVTHDGCGFCRTNCGTGRNTMMHFGDDDENTTMMFNRTKESEMLNSG